MFYSFHLKILLVFAAQVTCVLILLDDVERCKELFLNIDVVNFSSSNLLLKSLFSGKQFMISNQMKGN